VVDLLDTILVDNQMGQIVKFSEANDFIPAINVILLKIEISQICPVLLIDVMFTAYFLAIIPNQVEILYVYKSRRQDVKLAPLQGHVNED